MVASESAPLLTLPWLPHVHERRADVIEHDIDFLADDFWLTLQIVTGRPLWSPSMILAS
jgi:hypothetical protein